MPDYILGIHDGHNASAAILKDGELLFALQEERPLGIKNYSGFPERAIRACLDFAGIGPEAVRQAAFASHRVTPVHFRTTNMAGAMRRDATWWGIFRRAALWYPYYRFNRNLGWGERSSRMREMGFKPEQCTRFGHHRCHAATAYYGLREDPRSAYAIVTVDGYGDLDCATVWSGRDGVMKPIARTHLTHSLGTIYAVVTGAMGFVPLEHEYKLMGMAPYAPPKYTGPTLELFHSLLDVDEENLQFRRRTFMPTTTYSRRLRRMLVGHRFDQICAGLQRFTEDLLVKFVGAVLRKQRVSRLLCAGGVFMNVKANKRIMEMPEVDYLGVYPSCGDETLSIGAACLSHAETGGNGAADSIAPLGAYYLGTDVSEESCREVVEASGHEYKRYDDVEAEVVKALTSGHPVARCKGRMEFGARALGNRSILADPSNQDVVRVINQMVKKRDFWMPFAPVVRRERMNDYFVNPKNFRSPYMMLTFDSKDNFREFIAAVHNADLTARPQVIEKDHNPDYYRL
ncbi:MAG: carbamoyltransferase C-terminal domain-containing protein, partial [Phycisphaerae bacterium]